MSKNQSAALSGVTTILGQAWILYRSRLGTFLGVMITPMLVLIGLSAVLAGGGLLGSTLLSSKFAAGGIGLLILLAIVFFLAIFISQAWGQTALLYAIKDSQERIGVRESYRRGWHKILSYLWLSFLVGFITIGGFLLLIIPGIIFTVWFSLAMFVLVAEDLKGMNALLKSREYVRGIWGGIFWRFFFIGALYLIISSVPVFIFSFLKIPLGAEISRFVIGLFLTPLVMTYSFLVYSNIKAVKGEITFAPTRGQRTTFGVIAILGILAIPAFIFLTTFLIFNSIRGKVSDVNLKTNIEQGSRLPPAYTISPADYSNIDDGQKLADYIIIALNRGVLKNDIRNALIGVGWPPEDVDRTLQAVKQKP